jgi:hypothetical protein
VIHTDELVVRSQPEAEEWSAGQAPPPLRVELPDEALARSLAERLRPFRAQIVLVDGHYEVGIELRERNPEQRVVKALTAIDAWLLSARVPSVRVHLDGCSHTLHSPAAGAIGDLTWKSAEEAA